MKTDTEQQFFLDYLKAGGSSQEMSIPDLRRIEAFREEFTTNMLRGVVKEGYPQIQNIINELYKQMKENLT